MMSQDERVLGGSFLQSLA